MNTDYDVIIVGSGLVGCAAAACFGALGLKVALLEREVSTQQATPDERPLTLNYASVNVLKALGIWSSLDCQATPLTEVKITQQGFWGQANFHHQALSVPYLGYVVRYHDLMQQLYIRAQQQANFIPIDQIKSLSSTESLTTIAFSTQSISKQLTAQLVLACDGRDSVCRQSIGIKVKPSGGDRIARSMVLQLDEPHQGIAHQRMTKQGCLALMPLFSQDQYRLVWTAKSSVFKCFDALTEAEKIVKLRSHLSGYCPPIKRRITGDTYPIATAIAQRQVKDKVVLLGSAAHHFLPTTAQGFNLSLRDTAALAQLCWEAIIAEQDFSSSDVLKSYIDWQRPNQKATIELTQGIYESFQLRLPGSGLLRAIGLATVDCLPSVKQCLGRQLLGLNGKVPLLCLGVPLELACAE